MSGIEIIVVVTGLLLGYWIVSPLVSKKTLNNDDKARSAHQSSNGTGHQTRKSRPLWHEILELSVDAPLGEIRRSYKRLISQYHPDKVATLGAELRNLAERKSKEITGAYREALRLRGAEA